MDERYLQKHNPVMPMPWRAMAAVAVWLLSGGRANPADQGSAVSVREIFDVSLERTSGSLLTAHGRTAVETHAGCGPTLTVQRSLSDMTYKDGQPIRTDFASETWESSDGRTLRFRTRNAQNGYPPEIHVGTAKLSANGTGNVTFVSKDEPFALPPGTMFPGAFSRAMLAAAAGRHDLGTHIVFQGGARSALVTAAVRIRSHVQRAREQARDPAHLLKASGWPILISYFPDTAALPSSEVATTLYRDGLLGSFSVIYPGFSLRAKLVRVERLPSAC